MRTLVFIGLVMGMVGLFMATAAPTSLTVLVGAGKDTTTITEFLPGTVRIAVGSSITWEINSDEPHTVSFFGQAGPPPFIVPVPGGQPGEVMFNPEDLFPTRLPGATIESYEGSKFVGSGFMAKQGPKDAPPNKTFTLQFNKPGIYEYHCLLHPNMHGKIEVVNARNATGLTSQQAATTEAQQVIAMKTARVENARKQNLEARHEPGPNGTTFWFLKAGAIDLETADANAEAFGFFPKDLTIKAGDTIIWGSVSFHTITFNPTPPPPEAILLKPQAKGPPLALANPLVFAPMKPDAVYDPIKYYNSGDIGPAGANGISWALTFDKPGVYEYFCSLHREQGMKGKITVVER
jgi:plastocyanin